MSQQESPPRTAAEVNARVTELALRAVRASEPAPDTPAYQLWALCTAFVAFCKFAQVSHEQALSVFSTAWNHQSPPLAQDPAPAQPPHAQGDNEP
jgi:hypothetical protein